MIITYTVLCYCCTDNLCVPILTRMIVKKFYSFRGSIGNCETLPVK